MTKLQQLQQELFNLNARALTMLDENGLTEQQLTEVNNEIKTLKAKIKIAKETESQNVNTNETNTREGQVLDNNLGGKTEINARYEEALFNSLKGKATIEDVGILNEVRAALGSEIAADGGYLVPVDQQTQINELKRETTYLRDLVSVEPVITLSGSRVLEKDAEHVAFGAIGEKEAIPESSNPQFTPVSYKIIKYGGILPVPNEMLADTGTRLRGYLNKWLAKKSVATENNLIVEALKTFTKKAISGIDDVKDILDKDLDPSISAMSVIILNQDSFNYFNKLKDTQGRYILQTDATNPTKKLLGGRRVIVLSNRTLKTITNKAPVIIGSLKEGVVLFDRQTISLLATNTGGNSFLNDRTDIRAIMRFDVKKFDEKAVIYGELDLTAVGA